LLEGYLSTQHYRSSSAPAIAAWVELQQPAEIDSVILARSSLKLATNVADLEDLELTLKLRARLEHAVDVFATN